MVDRAPGTAPRFTQQRARHLAMQEFFRLCLFRRGAAVVFESAGGPSNGMPTRTQQSDILIAAYASHGEPNTCFFAEIAGGFRVRGQLV